MTVLPVRRDGIRRMLPQAGLNARGGTHAGGGTRAAGRHPGLASISTVLHREIVLPSEYDDDGRMEGARDPVGLWQAAVVKDRKDSTVIARSFTATLPDALSRGRQLELAREFASLRVDSDGNAADFEIYERTLPNKKEKTVVSVSFLFSTRKITPDGFGAKTAAEQRRGGAPDPEAIVSKEILRVRNAWSSLRYRAVAAEEARRLAVRNYKPDRSRAAGPDGGMNRDAQASLG